MARRRSLAHHRLDPLTSRANPVAPLPPSEPLVPPSSSILPAPFFPSRKTQGPQATPSLHCAAATAPFHPLSALPTAAACCCINHFLLPHPLSFSPASPDFALQFSPRRRLALSIAGKLDFGLPFPSAIRTVLTIGKRRRVLRLRPVKAEDSGKERRPGQIERHREGNFGNRRPTSSTLSCLIPLTEFEPSSTATAIFAIQPTHPIHHALLSIV